LLKVRWGTNEIITTLMMNYVAINLTSWLVKGPAKDPAVVPPQTRLIPPAARLPDLFGSGVHLGFLVGIVGAIGVAVLFRVTVAGFRLDTLGRNRRAAVHAGMPIDRLAVGALLASGALAGLAGANDVLGVKGLFQGNWNPAYGFAAFALVALARLDGFWLIPFAWLLALLAVGGESMTRPLAIPTSFVALLEGLVLLFFGLALALERRGVRRAGEIPAGSPTEMEPSSEPGTPPPSVTQAATEATPR
jgi:simple sugar transport system permease protein